MVDPGEIAIVHLTGRLVDGPEAGEVFETTDVDVALTEGIYHDHRDFKPLEFRVGEGHVIPGLDAIVKEMSEGEHKNVVLDPEEAYGAVDETAIGTTPREEIEERSGTTAEIGELVESETGELGWITQVDEETVTVDFNHELAGERVEFEVKVLETHGSVRDSSTKEATT